MPTKVPCLMRYYSLGIAALAEEVEEALEKNSLI